MTNDSGLVNPAPANQVTRALLAFGSALLLAGCSTYPAWLPSAGPSTEQVANLQNPQNSSGIQVIDVTDAVARRVVASQQRLLFSETLGAAVSKAHLIGPGDVVEISIWESPPAALFGLGALDPRVGAATTRATVLPEQMVNSSGQINVPFAGTVRAAGQSPQQIEAVIVQRLKGKANAPQVLVRVTKNATSNVTVVGEFASNTRMPLTPMGERLLDAVAAAGGVRQPVGKMTVQITRGSSVQALPLETIIQDPRQNVVLQAGDVVTALHQPLSFTVLGATGKNEELNFEAQGITLAQALARAGGLQDSRADARGVFVFRFEDPAALGLKADSGVQATPEGKIPVVYRVDLKDPATFFVAQGFPIRNKDVMYVSNSSAAELQKFLNIIGSVVSPVAGVRTLRN
ncbi:polysaccharide biosynthesis/export family protein [Rhodoferax antarcticus]|uniref:polysaccharide biosynthesis/export family protein n=1 Tax=Rhodoferax antarcticus TaxID=81479 RepID=UPI0022245FEE|nr:polysaccharide biosynthesis/export family protein [Rhodoferax antarcticus]MCW2314207.1 polysaccharide export outer membrane protein [Rhodoferax antarcticus]